MLESQDPSHLADWLLTRILGVDKALVELRDRGPLSRTDLLATVRSMNPGWTGAFAPQSIVSWLRSMGVIESTDQYKQVLTDVGRDWASRIHWLPEPLPVDPDDSVPPLEIQQPAVGITTIVPTLSSVIAAVQSAGHFPPSVIAQLHAGVWAHTRRHFAILTGLSGSGKTLLARAYGNAISGGGGERQVCTLPVQPVGSGNSDRLFPEILTRSAS